MSFCHALHELRTPLVAIIGRALGTGQLGDNDTRVGHDSAQRQGAIATHRRHLGRVASYHRQTPPLKCNADLTAVIESSVDAVLPAVEAKGITSAY